jgi:hypothetical protein
MPGIIVTRKNVNCPSCEFEALQSTGSSVPGDAVGSALRPIAPPGFSGQALSCLAFVLMPG